jgi:hypothetical protein
MRKLLIAAILAMLPVLLLSISVLADGSVGCCHL